MDEDEARRIFQQIISAIEYSHLHKLAHRDLKPENLLFDEDNNIKMIDFGLANYMKDGASLTTSCGSPNYAAPEVITGLSYGGPDVDIWSIGIILYAMVVGQLPFDDDQMSVLFAKIKEGKYFLPNHISKEVRDLINRMLQPNPVKRIKLAEIQQHKWYLTALPTYLKQLSSNPNRNEQHVDLDIVNQLYMVSSPQSSQWLISCVQIDKKLQKPKEQVIKDI